MFLAWMLVIFKENFFMIKLVNTVFLIDFIIRMFISPKVFTFINNWAFVCR